MVCCMLTNLAVPVSFAEETKKEPTYVRMDHPLKEENNWDISNELIMPGEAFYTVPKFEVTYDHGYEPVPETRFPDTWGRTKTL